MPGRARALAATDGKGAEDETAQTPAHHGIPLQGCPLPSTMYLVRASVVVGPVPIVQIQRYASPCGTRRAISQSCLDGAPKPGVGERLASPRRGVHVQTCSPGDGSRNRYLCCSADAGSGCIGSAVRKGRSGTGQPWCGAGWGVDGTERNGDSDEPYSSFTSARSTKLGRDRAAPAGLEKDGHRSKSLLWILRQDSRAGSHTAPGLLMRTPVWYLSCSGC